MSQPFIIPNVGEKLEGKPHKDIRKAVSTIYGDDPLLAVLREIGSNGFQHGKSAKLAHEYSVENRILKIIDYGEGCSLSKIKYFFNQDYGEGGQSVFSWNHWRLGMICVADIADLDTITIRNEDEKFIIRWSGKDLNEATLLYRGKNTDGFTGVTHEIILKATIHPTLQQLEDVLKLIWYWKVIHEQKIVILNGTQIEYTEYQHPELICDGDGKNWIHNFNIKSLQEGDIWINITSKRPLWFPDKNFLALYLEGYFVFSVREFFGSFNSVVFDNSLDTELFELLTAGKMVVKGFKSTKFWGILNEYINKNFLETTPTDADKQLFFEEIAKDFPLIPIDEIGKEPKHRKQKRYKWRIKHKGIKVPEIQTKNRDFQVKDIHDENLPFVFISIEGEKQRIILQLNDKEEDDKTVYPQLTADFLEALKRNRKDKYYFYIARITSKLQNGKKEFLDSEQEILEGWTKDDKILNDALKKREGREGIKLRNKTLVTSIDDGLTNAMKT